MIASNKFQIKITFRLVLVTALACGLAPLLYLYRNFTLIASWYQFFALILLYLIVPVLVLLAFYIASNNISSLKKYNGLLITVLNISIFGVLFIYSTYGLKKKLMLLAICCAFALSFFIYKHLKKIIKFELLLAIVSFMFLVPSLLSYFSYNEQWQLQPDAIETVRFKKTPNIYVIQPDGYIGLSEIDRGHYNKNNAIFETFLKDQDFTLYPEYRSNYYSTLSSNSSMFSMRHHYYNYKPIVGSELLFARDIVISDNAVLSILKNNNYKTSLILETPYLIASRPKMGYDYCNIDYTNLSAFSRGFDFKRDVFNDLKSAMSKSSASPQFYFIERIMPSHIATYKSSSEGKVGERLKYMARLEEANKWLRQMVEHINVSDPEALVVIVADHGGFVGYDFTSKSHVKPQNRDYTFSMFSSLLAIKWPSNVMVFDTDYKSSVNLFRSLFAVLSEDRSLLKFRQSDASYLTVNEGAPLGIYEVIDADNNAVFKPIRND